MDGPDGRRPAPSRLALSVFDAPQMQGDIGLAVSGGGDSMAMLHMVGPALRDAGRTVAVATVDHGLRPEAAAEAALVARECAALGLPHDTLQWRGWDGNGNLPAAAREGRYRLLSDWARGRGLALVALAHTQDDQAETFLMRLARGSGVDGLSAMQSVGDRFGMRWVRPFLGVDRAALRDWLTAGGIGWVEDPSNADPASERVRIRQALSVLDGLGIGRDAIAKSAGRLGQARNVLHLHVRDAAGMADQRAGALVFPRDDLLKLDVATRSRLIVAALRWLAGASYGPRDAALAAADVAIIRRQTVTLHGCIVIPDGDRVTLARELRPVASVEGPTHALWDHRWRLCGPHGPGLTIRALAEAGLRQCGDWRAAGLPRQALLATPAIWRGADLVAAPLAGMPAGWTAQTVADFGDFLKSD